MESAIVVIVDQDRALILQRGDTAPWRPLDWNLPGGGVDDGESPLQAAKRETLEEAGVVAINLTQLTAHDDPELGLIYVYVCDSYEGDVWCADGENVDTSWVTIVDLPRYTMVPYVEDAVMRALNWAAQQ